MMGQLVNLAVMMDASIVSSTEVSALGMGHNGKYAIMKDAPTMPVKEEYA